jgi:hypothetical protein
VGVASAAGRLTVRRSVFYDLELHFFRRSLL